MKLGIFGAGGAGRGLYDLMIRNPESLSRYDEIVFIDDVVEADRINGARVLKFQESINSFPTDRLLFLISLGNPSDRKKVYELIKNRGYSLATWIHPRAEINLEVRIDEGGIVYESYIDDRVYIGANAMVYKNAVIGHDSVIGRDSVISVNTFVGGHCRLGERVYLGAGAGVRDQINVGNDTVIGLNSAVYKDIPDNMAAIGNPARNIPKSSKGLFER